MDKNKDRWEEEAKERRNDQREKSADWVRKSKEEKILTLKVLSEVDKWEITRKLPGTFKTPEVQPVETIKNDDFEAYRPGEERRAEDGEVNDSGGGAHAAQLSEGDDGADQDGAQSSSVGLEACLPMSTHTHSAQPKLVRKQGRSTEEETDNRDGAHPEQQGEEDCQDRVESVGTDLPAHLVKNGHPDLPVQLVENLPVQLVNFFLVDGVQDNRYESEYVGVDPEVVELVVDEQSVLQSNLQGDPVGMRVNEYAEVGCEIQSDNLRGTMGELEVIQLEVIQSDQCEMTGSQIDGRHNPQGDQQGVGGCRNIHLGCTMCSRMSRLVMGTGHWG